MGRRCPSVLPALAVAHLILNNSYFKKATLLKHNSTILIGRMAKLNIIVKTRRRENARG